MFLFEIMRPGFWGCPVAQTVQAVQAFSIRRFRVSLGGIWFAWQSFVAYVCRDMFRPACDARPFSVCVPPWPFPRRVSVDDDA